MKSLIVVIACLALGGALLASPTATVTAVHHKSHHKAKKHHVKKVNGQKAPTPDRISEIQTALSRDGYYQGDPNGKLDSSTVAALQKFQSTHGIDANGKLDAPTLQKLGLGSNIAGVSAPKPVTPPSSGATPSTNSAPSAPALAPLASASAAGAPATAVASSASSTDQNPTSHPANH